MISSLICHSGTIYTVLFYFSRWYNLTITNPSYDNLGDYLCVAENNGGVMESKVTLTFEDPGNFITNPGEMSFFLNELCTNV